MGEYVVMYAILDDRIHFEMAVENVVYVTQRFKIDIEEEITQKADNYHNDKINLFLKMALGNTTFYRYYPTDEMIKELQNNFLTNSIFYPIAETLVTNEHISVEFDVPIKLEAGTDIIVNCISSDATGSGPATTVIRGWPENS